METWKTKMAVLLLLLGYKCASVPVEPLLPPTLFPFEDVCSGAESPAGGSSGIQDPNFYQYSVIPTCQRTGQALSYKVKSRFRIVSEPNNL